MKTNCRFCFSANGPLVGVTKDVEDLFESCFKEKLRLKPDSLLCQICLDKLEDFKDFRAMCLESELEVIIETTGGNLVQVVEVAIDGFEEVEETEGEEFVIAAEPTIEDALPEVQAIVDVNNEEEVEAEEEGGTEFYVYSDGEEWPDEQESEDLEVDPKRRKIDQSSVSYDGLILSPDPEIIQKIIRQRQSEGRRVKKRYPYKSKRNPKTCETCSETVPANLFQVHLLTHRRPEDFTYWDRNRYANYLCATCNAFFVDIDRHKFEVHSEGFTASCEVCQVTMKRDMLPIHMKRHEEALSCGICGKTFQTKHQIQLHIEKLHFEECSTLLCEYCNEAFTRHDFLAEHIESVHERKAFFCDDCGKSFASKTYLAKHKYKSTFAPCLPTTPEIRGFKAVCVCGTESYSMAQYLRHLEVHKSKDDNRLHCPICKKHYAYKKPFMLHISKDHAI